MSEKIKVLGVSVSEDMGTDGELVLDIATDTLKAFVEKHKIPVVETQAGKSALAWDHPYNFGPVGVTGCESANIVSEQADLVIGIGTRFQDDHG